MAELPATSVKAALIIPPVQLSAQVILSPKALALRKIFSAIRLTASP
jgi:hypothetical protein